MGQNPSKYQVTDDGKVFLLNEDGSVSEYGRVQPNTSGKSKSGPTKPFNKMIWWIAVLLLVGVLLVAIDYLVRIDIYFHCSNNEVSVAINQLWDSAQEIVRYCSVTFISFVLIMVYMLYALRRYSGGGKSSAK